MTCTSYVTSMRSADHRNWIARESEEYRCRFQDTVTPTPRKTKSHEKSLCGLKQRVFAGDKLINQRFPFTTPIKILRTEEPKMAVGVRFRRAIMLYKHIGFVL